MQYYFYLDKVLMPVTPSSLNIKMKNKNKLINLASGEEVNLINPPGLTEIKFDLLIPSAPYPFAVYGGDFREPGYYIEHIESLKRKGLPFEFLVIRTLTYKLALRLAAKQLKTPAELAEELNGKKSDRITSATARILLRNEQSGGVSYVADTSMKVTLEDYSVVEDAEKYGRDFCVSVKLLQYDDGSAKTSVLRQ